MNQKQRRRIEKMTEIYHQEEKTMKCLQEIFHQLKANEQNMKDLEAYYQGTEFLEDYDTDAQGEIDKTMDRSILSEDAIDDLLTEREDLLRDFYQFYLDSVSKGE